MEAQPEIVGAITKCPMCGGELPGQVMVSDEGEHIIQLEDGDMEQVFFTDMGLIRLHPNPEVEGCFIIETLHDHE